MDIRGRLSLPDTKLLEKEGKNKNNHPDTIILSNNRIIAKELYQELQNIYKQT